MDVILTEPCRVWDIQSILEVLGTSKAAPGNVWDHVLLGIKLGLVHIMPSMHPICCTISLALNLPIFIYEIPTSNGLNIIVII